MLKLASLAFVPVMTATFLTHSEPLPPPPTVNMLIEPSVAEQQDRELLENLSVKELPPSAAEQADKELLTNLVEEDKLPVRRAIAIEKATAAETIIMDDAAVEVRRAIPVTTNYPVSSNVRTSGNLRNTFQQPFMSMVEPEVRRATAVDQRRASITIFGDDVILRSKGQIAGNP